MNEAMIETISDILVGIAAIVVAVCAVKGLNTWRSESQGKAIFEASKKMMGFVYKVKDGYQYTAGLMTSSTESIDRAQQAEESPTVKQVLDEWYAKSKRLEPVLENWNNLAEANWEVRTILGKEASKKIEELVFSIKAEISNLSSAIYAHFDIREEEAKTGYHNKRNEEFEREMHKIVYQSEHSEEIKKLNDIVDEIDKELSPYLRGAIKWKTFKSGPASPAQKALWQRFWAKLIGQVKGTGTK